MIEAPLTSFVLTIVITVLGAVLAVVMIITAVKDEERFSIGVIGAGRTILLLINIYLIALATNFLGITTPRIEWWGLVVPGLLVIVSIIGADGLAIGTLGAQRGKFRSRRYRRLLRPADEEVEIDLEELKLRLIQNVIDSKVDSKKLTGVALIWWNEFEKQRSTRRQPPKR